MTNNVLHNLFVRAVLVHKDDEQGGCSYVNASLTRIHLFPWLVRFIY